MLLLLLLLKLLVGMLHTGSQLLLVMFQLVGRVLAAGQFALQLPDLFVECTDLLLQRLLGLLLALHSLSLCGLQFFVEFLNFVFPAFDLLLELLLLLSQQFVFLAQLLLDVFDLILLLFQLVLQLLLLLLPLNRLLAQLLLQFIELPVELLLLLLALLQLLSQL